jgi:hypothetical protein
MTARRVGLASALVTMAASGWYVAVYLARWEWNRALVAGVIFLVAEIGLLGMLVLDRLSAVRQRLDALERSDGRGRADGSSHEPVNPRVLDTIRETAPPPRKPFTWLGRSGGGPDQLGVFVPVLLGAGILLSGAAWVVERIGRMTAGPAMERQLARQLDMLALPPGGLLGKEPAEDPFSPSPAKRPSG